MTRDADSHAEEDRQKREAIESKNRLDSLIYQTEKTISDNREKIPVGLISEVETVITEAKKVVEIERKRTVPPAQLENLTRVSHRMAEALSTSNRPPSGAGTDSVPPTPVDRPTASGSGAAGGATGSGAGNDDVIDAEYIDVDDKR
jgi:molecular chaperone DnaK